jgi:hypothetical protein
MYTVILTLEAGLHKKVFESGPLTQTKRKLIYNLNKLPSIRFRQKRDKGVPTINPPRLPILVKPIRNGLIDPNGYIRFIRAETEERE